MAHDRPGGRRCARIRGADRLPRRESRESLPLVARQRPGAGRTRPCSAAWTSYGGAAPPTNSPPAPSTWEMPVYTSAPSRPPTREPTFPRKRTHDRTEHRHEVVGLGPTTAERAPHRGRVHIHPSRHDEALRLPHGRASTGGYGATAVRVRTRRYPRDIRRRPAPPRPVHSPRGLPAVR